MTTPPNKEKESCATQSQAILHPDDVTIVTDEAGEIIAYLAEIDLLKGAVGYWRKRAVAAEEALRRAT